MIPQEKEMIQVPNADNSTFSLDEQVAWITKNIRKENCVMFISNESEPDFCGCGYKRSEHSQDALDNAVSLGSTDVRWTLRKHTKSSPTDAFGTIKFQSELSRSRTAQYIRLSFDTKPVHVMKIISHVWNIPLPKLVISVIGGDADFDMTNRSMECLEKGILNVASTTRAWFITNGFDAGVSRLVGNVFDVSSPKLRQRAVVIGFVPWGQLSGKESFIGIDKTVNYNPLRYKKSNVQCQEYTLNSSHTHFFLVDNGSRTDAVSTNLFRKVVERCILRHVVASGSPMLMSEIRQHIPVISLALEGNDKVIKEIIERITYKPPIPVVTYKQSLGFSEVVSLLVQNDDEANKEMCESLMSVLHTEYKLRIDHVTNILNDLNMCVKLKQFITVFDDNLTTDFDQCIFSVLLHHISTSDAVKLDLALSWDQYAMAKVRICNVKTIWPEEMIYDRLITALTESNIPTVKLFFDHGLPEHEFLTSSCLEDLYNKSMSRKDTLHLILKGLKKNYKPFVQPVSLEDIGHVMEKLMGFGFNSTYTRQSFIVRHNYREMYGNGNFAAAPITFAHPNTELLIWAILTKRHIMAKFFWERGKQALIKALLGMKLNNALAHEAEQDELEPDVGENFKQYSEEFAQLGLDFRDKCYAEDPDRADQLILHEVKSLGEWTCLFLAARAHHREFIARPECQILLSDLWMGGMNERKWLEWKVFFSIICPPAIAVLIEYKSERELEKMAQTEEEHQQEMLTSSDSSSSESSSSDDEDDTEIAPNFRYYRSRRRIRHLSERSTSSSIVRITNQHHNNINHSFRPDFSPLETINENSADFITVNEDDIKIHIADYNSEPSDGRKSCTSTITGQGSLVGNLKPVKILGVKLPFIKKRRGELGIKKKLYEFFNAPVTKYVLNFISYFIFLLIYVYMLLDIMDDKIKGPEIYVNIHIASLGVDMLLEYLNYPVRSSTKLITFLLTDNRLSLIGAEIVHSMALVARLLGFLEFGHLLYCVCIIYWFTRLLSLMAVTKRFASIIYIAEENLCDLWVVSVIVLIGLTGFGLFRHAIKYPNAGFNWSVLTTVFVEPYYMLYGEVYADSIVPTCTEPGDPGCAYGHWVTAVVMVFYMLLCNLLLLNILGAKFTNTFSRISSQSDLYYKFHRYHNVTYYECKSRLPPPFVLLSTFHYIYKSIKRYYKGVPKPYSEGLKVYLSDSEVEDLVEWEEMCLEEYFCERERKKADDPNQQISEMRRTINTVVTDVNQLSTRLGHIRLQLDSLTDRIEHYQNQKDILFPSILSKVNPSDPQVTGLAPRKQSSRTIPSLLLASPRTSIGNGDENDSHAKIVNRVLRKQVRRAGYSPPPCWRPSKRNSSVPRRSKRENSNEQSRSDLVNK